MSKEYNSTVTLPSRGVLYDGKVPDGTVTVEPWSTKEERILASPSVPFSSALDKLIQKCTDIEMSPSDLLLVDRWFLFIWMRCISYGGDYSFQYKCDSCGEQQTHFMNLEKDLDVVYSDDEEMLAAAGLTELREPFELTFPVNEHTIGWRMLRGADETRVDKYVKQLRRRKSFVDTDDSGYLYRAALRIETIDGNKTDVVSALKFIEDLRGRDSLAFREAIDSVSVGIRPDLFITCKCGWENEITIPLDKTFFRPGRRSAQAV